MSPHVRTAQIELGGGIRRAPRPEQNYENISHSLIRDGNISYTASGVLIRLLSNADNVSQTADDLVREKNKTLARRRGNGRRAVLAALAELRLAGYLQTFVVQGTDGQFKTFSIIFDAPQPLPEGWRPSANGVLHPGGGVPGDGGCAQVIEKTGVRIPTSGCAAAGMRTPIEALKKVPKEKSSSTRARAPADAGAAAAEPAVTVKKPKAKALRMIHGLACWTDEDARTASALLQIFGQEALESAAAAVRAGGRYFSLPGRVLQELQQRTSAAQALRQSEQAEARATRIEAESKRRGEQELAELMALQTRQTPEERDS